MQPTGVYEKLSNRLKFMRLSKGYGISGPENNLPNVF